MVSEGTDKQCCPALFCYLVRRTCCLHQYDVSAWQPCLCNVSLLFLFFILDLDMRVLNFYNRYCLAISVLSAVLMGLICAVVWSAVKTRVFFVLYIGLPVTAQSSTTNCCQTSQFCWTPSAIISRKERKKTQFNSLPIIQMGVFSGSLLLVAFSSLNFLAHIPPTHPKTRVTWKGSLPPHTCHWQLNEIFIYEI